MPAPTAVIGAGVVGLAVARALAMSGREVVVLDRAEAIGTGISSRNSEVIHSGLYYAPGSLKARLCASGRELLYRYCRHRAIAHRRTGKLIVATSGEETRTLDRYQSLAAENGAGPVERLEAAEVQALEPELRCIGALHLANTGIIDSHGLMQSLWQDLQSGGGTIALGTEVRGGRRRRDGTYELEVSGTRERYAFLELVNCAGLDAPALARRLEGCGSQTPPRAYFARGHYFALNGPSPFRRLVYPVAESAGLGIHVTLDLDGRARFGPDVEWCDGPDYRFDESRRGRFIEAIRRYYPGLDAGRLLPGYVGVRPKIAPDGATADFRIDGPRAHGVQGLVQLYGIESPGLTAALAIGDYVVAELAATAGAR
ncbi:MAG: NAD(P)/FAD-dependent oxidoreductase [Gammaproteobacteria bacterium]